MISKEAWDRTDRILAELIGVHIGDVRSTARPLIAAAIQEERDRADALRRALERAVAGLRELGLDVAANEFAVLLIPPTAP